MARSGLAGKELNIAADNRVKPAGWFSQSAAGADGDLLLALISFQRVILCVTGSA